MPERQFIISEKIREQKLKIRLYKKVQTHGDILHKKGIKTVMIKILLEKFKSFSNHQKQILPQEVQEQQLYLLLGTVLCTMKQPQIFTIKRFLLVLKEPISSKLVVLPLIIIGFLQEITSHWEGLGCK